MHPPVRSLLVLGLLALGLSPSRAQARPFRLNQLPNTPAGCATCHISPGGGGPRNAFGEDVNRTLQGGNVVWADLFDLDSDGDGYTNGQELADPSGTWRIGDSRPTGNVSQPGSANSTLCDNGTLETAFDEECDLDDFGGETCQTQGFVSGSLSCQACRISTASCSNEAVDMGAPGDMGGSPDMGSDPDLGGPADMGLIGPADMATPGPDLGSGGENGGGNAGPDDADDGDDGCQAVTAGSMLWLLLPLGMARRRRRA